MVKIQIKKTKLSEIRLNPDNPRTISKKNMDLLVKSLREFPEMLELREIVVDETMTCIGGNMRMLALRKIGAKECIAKIVTGLTPEQKREFIVKDNSGFGSWDMDSLSSSWTDLPLVDWGVDLPEDWLKEEETVGDAEPQIDKAEELNKVWQVNPGDLWQIGEHRLLCGDSTKKEDVEKVMDEERAHLCFTSPPYGQQRDYDGDTKEKVSDWDGLMQGVFGNLPMADDAQVLVNLGMIHRDGEWVPYWDGWIDWMRSQGWRRFGWYVWDQGPGLPGDWNGRFAPSHEFIFHFNHSAIKAKKTVPCKHAGEKNHGRGLRGKDGIVNEYSHSGRDVQSVKIPDSVIRVSREKFSTGIQSLTAAPFPIAFPSVFIECWPGDVYEPFSGSGTTMVACQNLNRKCRGIEISPQYVAVCLERMFDAFGIKGERIE